MRQKAARCSSFSASTAFVHSPSSMAAASVSSSISRSGTAGCAAAISTITYQGLSSAIGIRVRWPLRSTISMQRRRISSKAITSAPLPSTRDNSESAASGEGTAAKAVSTRFSAGTSLSAAAVMTPSVPSPPRNRWRSA